MKSNQKYQNVSNELDDIFKENLKKILLARGYTQGRFVEEMNREKISLGRTSLNKILNGSQRVSAAFLLSCCDYFKIPVHDFVSPEFDPERYIENVNEKYENYIDIAKMNDRHEAKTEKEDQKKQSVLFGPMQAKHLVTDPENDLFEGYLQDYYCYYYPTSSKENKENNKILRGILKLEPEDGWCRATLKINTGSFSDCGEVNFKIYTGYAAIPAYGTTLNCIMYSDKLGEFCNLMFRYFKINFGKQDLRIAEVLSASLATENRRPTTHRMLLSREEIKDKDLQIILPALELNYSTLTVVKDRLESVGEISDDYQKIVNKIISESEKKETYFLAESDVKNIAKKYMKTSIEIKEFIMQVRKVAYSYRYNKIGNKADTIVRDILLSKGYYKQENQV